MAISKITSTERDSVRVYGLPDKPGLSKEAMQQRFDGLGDLAIDKLNEVIDEVNESQSEIDSLNTKVDQIANNQIPEEYVQKVVDDYVENNSSNIATKTEVDAKIDEVSSQFSSEIVEIEGTADKLIFKNLFDSANALSGKVLHALYGAMDNASYNDTNYIKVDSSKPIYLHSYQYAMDGTAFYVNTWGKDKNGISNNLLGNVGVWSDGAKTCEITVNSDVHYVSFAIPSNHDITKFSVSNTDDFPSEYPTYNEPYFTEMVDNHIREVVTITSKLKGKKGNLLGDSITSTDYVLPTWWQRIAEETGATFNNYGVSGTPIKHTNDNNGFVDRYTSMDTSADFVLVMGGTNDTGTPIGYFDDTRNTTFMGALIQLIEGLLKTYVGKPIIFCTPIKLGYSDGSYYVNPRDTLKTCLNTKTEESVTLQLRAEAIKLKCEQYGLPCIDLWNHSGINAIDADKVYFLDDLTHPSEQGQERIYRMILNELERLI